MAYQCKGCEERFIRQSVLDRHTCRSSLTTDSHKCADCGMVFKTKEILSKHSCNNTDRNVDNATSTLVKCQYCDAQFTNVNTLKIHERIHTGDMPYKCTECGEKFPYHSNLRAHMRIHNDPIDRPHKCNQCGAKFSQIANLHAHERTHATDRTTTCDKCKGLIPENCTHVCPKDSGDPFYKCVECGARFTVKNTLEIHMRTHTGEKPYKCTQCNERFIQPNSLQSHMRTHTTPLDHECGECGQRFATEDRLREHVRTHAQFTLHKCSVCQAAFASETRLLVHMEQKHTVGTKRFTCTQCSQAFSSKPDLEAHVQSSHPAVTRPNFKCLKCTHAFTTFILLQNHMQVTHPSPSDPYPNADHRCEDCGSRYTTQNRLIAHRRTKHPDKSTTVRRPEDDASTSKVLSTSENLLTSANTQKENEPTQINAQKPILQDAQPADDQKINGQKQTTSLTRQGSPTDGNQNLDGQVSASPGPSEAKRKAQETPDLPAKKSSVDANTNKRLQCKKCDESFDNQYLIHIHERGHIYETGCNRCGGVRCKCQSDSTSRNKHKKRMSKCLRCKGKFPNYRQFRDHTCTSRGGDRNGKTKQVHEVSSSSAASDGIMPKCPECGIKYIHAYLVDIHLLNVHKKSYRTCHVCHKRFTHPIQCLNEPKDKLDTCTQCSASNKVEEICHTNADQKNKPTTVLDEPKLAEHIKCNSAITKVEIKDDLSSNGATSFVEERLSQKEPNCEEGIAEKDEGHSLKPVGVHIERKEEVSMHSDLKPIHFPSGDMFRNYSGSDNDSLPDTHCYDTCEDDDADDTKGVNIVEVKTLEFSGEFIDHSDEFLELESKYNIKSENTSALSHLVPKLITILVKNVEDAKLEDFGWPTASSWELIERAVIRYGGIPAENVGSADETLAANCKELIILSIGSADAEKVLEGQTMEDVVAKIVASEAQEN